MLRCPVCKAENASGPACRRCKADLSPLWSLEAARDAALREARRRLRAGDLRGAGRLASAADRLRAGNDSRRLLALTRLLAGEFAEAWRRVKQMQSSAV